METSEYKRRKPSKKLGQEDFISMKGIVTLLQLLYTGYGFLIFSLLFFIFTPFLLVPVLFNTKHHWVGIINRWWARLLFLSLGLPIRLRYEFKRDPHAQYIFCPNHFSYLDIPTMGLNQHNAIFVGKSSLNSIPLFGFLYRKLHITVDRSSLKSKYSTLVRAKDAIDEGKSLVIFPEGGMHATNLPIMAPLKDGAFRIAIEKQIPIVPVSIPDNWIILPEESFLLRWRPIHVIYHTPIETAGMSLKDINSLKEKVTHIINQELLKTTKEELGHSIRTA